MTCPACGKLLRELNQSGLVVDVCETGCGGIWFDNFELKKVDEGHEAAGERLLDLGPHAPVRADRGAKRACPKCANQPMQRHYFSVRREVEVDACPACGGIWLDTVELAAIRKEFTTEQERKQAAEAYFTKVFERDLQAQAAKGEADLARAKKFASALRFVCPSNWLPGKQAGGAF